MYDNIIRKQPEGKHHQIEMIVIFCKKYVRITDTSP